MHARYFDNAATTPVDPRVLDEMLPFLGDAFGNANSLHAWGRRAHAAVDLARERVANLIGAEDPSQITFLSGATEANNWILRAYAPGGTRFDARWQPAAISPFEHSSLFEPARALHCGILHNDGLHLLPPSGKTNLVSVMAVNNEIGTKWVASDLRGSAVALHSDLTQAVAKIPISLDRLDYASFSAHKFYGPKGIGALYAADGPPEPMILGGEQENGRRGGTLNVPAIVGMGAAAAIAADEMAGNHAHSVELRRTVLDALGDTSEMHVNGGDDVSPYILSVSFRAVEAESIVIDLDRKGFAVSGGAACSSRSNEPSHVLRALRLTDDWSRGTVRISFGKANDCESAAKLGHAVRETVENLRKMHE